MSKVRADRESRAAASRWGGFVVSAAGVALLTWIVEVVPGLSGVSSFSMLYLLVVFVVAVRYGRGPALMAAVLSYLAIDWYFVSPGALFASRDPAEWLALGMFILTAMVMGQFTALLRARETEARLREQEAAVLASASWAVASEVQTERALTQVLRRLDTIAAPEAAAVYAISDQGISVVASIGDRARVPIQVHAQGSDGPEAVFPLQIQEQILGYLYLRVGREPLSSEKHRVIESLANHAALVLQRDRLLRAETQARALQEADRLKTALLSMVSHDFHSPLCSIKASVTGLLQSGAPGSVPMPWDPESQSELLQGIDLETDRLIRMVENILALSRLEADAWAPQREATSVTELVGAALDTFSGEENRRIQLHFAPELLEEATEAFLDPVQMVQVLHNLLENALKYSPVESSVELRAERKGDQLLLEVRDRGPGLPPGSERQLFDRFYRGPGLGESAIPGLGIGLALCHGLVEAHGGSLTAANRPTAEGQGAVFRVVLPLLEPHRAALQPLTLPTGAPGGRIRSA